MAHPTDEAQAHAVPLDFDRRLMPQSPLLRAITQGCCAGSMIRRNSEYAEKREYLHDIDSHPGKPG